MAKSIWVQNFAAEQIRMPRVFYPLARYECLFEGEVWWSSHDTGSQRSLSLRLWLRDSPRLRIKKLPPRTSVGFEGSESLLRCQMIRRIDCPKLKAS